MFFLIFICAVIVTWCLTFGVRYVMKRWKVIDHPLSPRKIHSHPIPLGGGIAIYLAFCIMTWGVYFFTSIFGHEISWRSLLGVCLGGLVLMIGGMLDDIYNLPVRKQIWFPILAALVIIFFGIGPHVITNPFGGVIRLDQWIIPVDGLGNWVVFADIVVFLWLMGMMFTTKLLDGLDGLVTGIVAIGALMIFFLSRQPQWMQTDVAMLAIILAGVCVGFLFWNFHPAKIFLGESGSLFTGFILGTLAIISGAKIATTLLVVGLPMLDIVRVMVRRWQKGQPIFKGDREHLHFKLLHSGLTQRQAVLLFYTIAVLFGMTTLFLQSQQKFIALVFLFILMLALGLWFSSQEKQKQTISK